MSHDFGTPPPKDGSTSDERLWALIAHLSPFVVPVLGPLIVWVVQKDKSEFVADQAKESLNFQLSIIVVGFLIGAGGIATFGFGFLLLPVLGIFATIYQIIAAMEANKGVRYRYPYTFRFIQ